MLNLYLDIYNNLRMKKVLLIFLTILFSCNDIKKESSESSSNDVYYTDGVYRVGANISISTSSQLIVGEKIIIKYSINDRGTNFIPPDLSDLKVLGEPKTSTQSVWSSANGNTTKTTFSIEIEAEDVGLYIISPASVMVKGKKIVSKEFKLNITDLADAIESELKSLEKGVYHRRYHNDILKKVVYDFGPLSVRKEEKGWYVYSFTSSYQLTKIPLDSIYKKDMSLRNIRAIKNKFVISNTSNQNVSNIVASKENPMDRHNYKSERGYSYINEQIGVKYVDLEFNRSYANIKAIVWNTNNYKIKDFKIEVTISDDMEGKNIISTDTITFNTYVNPKEMKFISSKYTPTTIPSSNFNYYFHKLIGD